MWGHGSSRVSLTESEPDPLWWEGSGTVGVHVRPTRVSRSARVSQVLARHQCHMCLPGPSARRVLLRGREELGPLTPVPEGVPTRLVPSPSRDLRPVSGSARVRGGSSLGPLSS